MYNISTVLMLKYLLHLLATPSLVYIEKTLSGWIYQSSVSIWPEVPGEEITGLFFSYPGKIAKCHHNESRKWESEMDQNVDKTPTNKSGNWNVDCGPVETCLVSEPINQSQYLVAAPST